MSHFLLLTTSLFFIGFFGILLNRKNILILLMSIALMLLAVNLNFIIYATSFGDHFGLIFALLILNVAAAESAIGLAILVVYYRLRGSIQIGQFNLLRG